MVAIDRSTNLVDMECGTVSREIFCNQDVYDQEQEQVFGRSCLFVGHVSQIPNPVTMSSLGWARNRSSSRGTNRTGSRCC